MRLIHTADWHLGQNFHGYDRHDEHQVFLDTLLDLLDNEEADALLIAGDVFDSAHPPVQAQRQLYTFLAQARQRRPSLQTLIIAGNHDSAVRLEVAAPLTAAFGTRIVGQVPRQNDGSIDPDRLILPLHDAEGRVAALCLTVPFLRPSDLPPRADADEDAYLGGVSRLYREVTARALSQRQPGQALIAMGHCHLSGGDVSPDSERRIIIGGAEALPAAMFDPALAYVALGHLHRAQRIDGERVRYSGSPLPMSFAETGYTHQVLSLELDGEALGEVRALPLPRPVPLLRVPAQPAPPEQVLAALEALQTDFNPDHDASHDASARRPYLEVRVQLDAPEPNLRHRIESALADKPVRLARIELNRKRAAASSAETVSSLDELGRIDPQALFEQHHRQRYGNDAAPELLAAFATLLHSETR